MLVASTAGCAGGLFWRDSSRRAVGALRQDILAATSLPGVTRGTWGIVVHSLDRDQRLLELAPRALLVPASLVKIVTVATAADAVGWDHRFETRLLATGPLVDGSLDGDLVVVGSGDPSLGGRGGPDMDTLVAALAAQGVRRIAGRVVGDDDALEEPRPQLAWAWDDLGYPTGAIFGALNFAENRTVATVSPGPVAGAPAAVEVEAGATARPVTNRTVTTPGGSVPLLWPEQRPGEERLTVAGEIPIETAPVSVGIAVGNPTLWFAHRLTSALEARGIDVEGEAADIDELRPMSDRSEATSLHTHISPPLAELAVLVLKESINLYAEALMRLNADPSVFPTNDAALAGLAARLTAWAVPEGSYQIVDGSGLSRRNALSAEAILAVLRRMAAAGEQSPFMAALPVAGVDGSLATRMRGTAAEGRVQAKTGTMTNIRSLAGYATTVGGERLAFVAMVNNFEGTGAQATEAIDAIAVRLAGFSRR